MRYSKFIILLIRIFALSFFSGNPLHGLSDHEKKLFEGIRDQKLETVKEAINVTGWLAPFAVDLNMRFESKSVSGIEQKYTPLMAAATVYQKNKNQIGLEIFQAILNAKYKDNNRRVLFKSSGSKIELQNYIAIQIVKLAYEEELLKKLFQSIVNKVNKAEVGSIIDNKFVVGEGFDAWFIDLNGINTGKLVPGYDETDTPALVAAKVGNFEAAQLIFNAKNAAGSYRVKRDTDQSKEAIKLIKKHFEDLYTKELFEAIRDSKDISVTLKKEFKLCDGIEPFRADLNRKNDLVVGIDKDKTPLFAATAEGSPEMVQALVEAKSDTGEALIDMDVPENVEALRKVVETGSEDMQKAILTEKSLAPAFSTIVREKIAAIEGDGASVDVKKRYKDFLEHCKSDLEVNLEGLQKKLGALKEKLKALAGTLGELKKSLGATP